MTKLIATEYDAITGIQEERPLTTAEIAEFDYQAQLIVERQEAAALKAEAKAALLARLGITAEEAELLLA